MKSSDPSPNQLRELLRYDPDTGKLFWRERGVHWFRTTDGRTAAHACANWNSKFAGKEAMTANDLGYRSGTVLNRVCIAHRVIWAMAHGAWPSGQIDHINHVRDDNRLENLRVVTHAENGRNVSLAAHNTSGIIGVCWSNTHGKWLATIRVAGRAKHLGLFAEIGSAAAARKAAEERFGFHCNHGKRV